MVAKRKGLGKGADILFGDTEEEKESYFQCNINSIVPNKHQPRLVFKDIDIEELSKSIKENGVIQPLVVMRVEGEGKDTFELIAGERRLRASKLAGLKEVPVVVKEVENEETLLELAIIENVQRTDLNPIEEAEAYKKLIDKFGYTQEETANKVGKKRSTISNLIRLLKLPQFLQDDISNDLLSEGHARCLLRLEDDTASAKEIRDLIIKNALSVRQTEKLVRKLLTSPSSIKTKKSNKSLELSDSYITTYMNQLETRLGSKVKFNQSGTRGTIEVEYYSKDDLERVIGLITE